MPDASSANASTRVITGTLALKPSAIALFLVSSCIPFERCALFLEPSTKYQALRTIYVQDIQLHSILAVPNICLECVGEFDAALQLGSLPRRLNTIPPNRFQRPVLWPSHPELQMPILDDNRLRQTPQ